MRQIQDLLVDQDDIEDIHAGESIDIEIENVSINEYVIMRSRSNSKSTALVRYIGDGDWKKVAPGRKLETQGFQPKDANQSAFMDCILNKKILVNIAIGTAGTGKTTLALACALDAYQKDRKKIILCKPTAMVGEGKAFGPVPGDISEKYAPYLASYDIVFKKILGEGAKVLLGQMKNSEDLEFIPIELARGCTYDNCTFILDEAQNLTWHELNTIVSRMGENTTMVILGDLKQIDTGTPENATGLSKLIRSSPFKWSPITSVVELETQYRSPITKLVADVNEWVINEKRAHSTKNQDTD